jgi:hypothetical protein
MTEPHLNKEMDIFKRYQIACTLIENLESQIQQITNAANKLCMAIASQEPLSSKVFELQKLLEETISNENEKR